MWIKDLVGESAGAVHARSARWEQGRAALLLAASVGGHVPCLDLDQPRKDGSGLQTSPWVTAAPIQMQPMELLNPKTCSGWREKVAAQRLHS